MCWLDSLLVWRDVVRGRGWCVVETGFRVVWGWGSCYFQLELQWHSMYYRSNHYHVFWICKWLFRSWEPERSSRRFKKFELLKVPLAVGSPAIQERNIHWQFGIYVLFGTYHLFICCFHYLCVPAYFLFVALFVTSFGFHTIWWLWFSLSLFTRILFWISFCMSPLRYVSWGTPKSRICWSRNNNTCLFFLMYNQVTKNKDPSQMIWIQMLIRYQESHFRLVSRT